MLTQQPQGGSCIDSQCYYYDCIIMNHRASALCVIYIESCIHRVYTLVLQYQLHKVGRILEMSQWPTASGPPQLRFHLMLNVKKGQEEEIQTSFPLIQTVLHNSFHHGSILQHPVSITNPRMPKIRTSFANSPVTQDT